MLDGVTDGKESSTEVGEMLNVELRDMETATVLDGDADIVLDIGELKLD